MTLRHYAFVFDVVGFRHAVLPLVERVERGDLAPLYNEARKTIKESVAETWPFHEAGSPLLSEDDIDRLNFAGVRRTQPIAHLLPDLSAVHPGDIGYWILVVMSRFVEKTAGIGSDYSILESALTNLGWGQEDCEQLIYGLPSCRLVQADCRRVFVRTDQDPYWHWILPSHAKSSGWLPADEVTRLANSLRSIQFRVRDYDLLLFPNPWQLSGEALGDSQRDYYERLQHAFGHATTTLQQAQQADRGLFMVMAY